MRLRQYLEKQNLKSPGAAIMDWKSSSMSSRFKMALSISDVRPTPRPEIVEVVLCETGKPMRLRRDMVEFWPGRVIVPLWLGLRVLRTPTPHFECEAKQGLGFNERDGVGGQNLNRLSPN